MYTLPTLYFRKNMLFLAGVQVSMHNSLWLQGVKGQKGGLKRMESKGQGMLCHPYLLSDKG